MCDAGMKENEASGGVAILVRSHLVMIYDRLLTQSNGSPWRAAAIVREREAHPMFFAQYMCCLMTPSKL